MAEDVLQIENVAKRFGPVTALRNVNLHLGKGEVLGLLGDNGAGKSTLIKIISGFQKPDEGRILVRGEEVELKSVDHARSLGIDCVYQDLALVNELSVTSNMFLRRERVHKPLPLLARRAMARDTRKALDQIGINLPRIDVPVARLSGGQRQAIAVARTVTSDADILLLDEPLAAMGAKEGAMILDLVARLRAEGRVSIIMIAHNYVHVLEACDRVNLIQDGEITLRQADGGHVGRGAQRDRRRGVPPRPSCHGRRGRCDREVTDVASTHNGRCSDAKVTQNHGPHGGGRNRGRRAGGRGRRRGIGEDTAPRPPRPREPSPGPLDLQVPVRLRGRDAGGPLHARQPLDVGLDHHLRRHHPRALGA